MKYEHEVGILRWVRKLRDWASAGLPDEDPEEWRRDPLSHPALREMSMTQLADLPFKPRQFSDEEDLGSTIGTELTEREPT